MAETILVELLTEELPPKALSALGAAFASGIRGELVTLGLAPPNGKWLQDLATPRRLAVLIHDVAERAASEEKEVSGPSAGAPAAAVAGFAKKHGIAVESLQKRPGAKGEVFVARVKAGGAALDDALAGVVERAVKKLPIPKVMRWGDGDAQFLRPVHGLVMLHGARVVPGTVLGLAAGNRTKGHRFMGKSDLTIAGADQYLAQLRDEGSVICRFAERKSAIERGLTEHAARQDADLGTYQDLLDEVTALVEHPTVYVGTFPASFLDVPQECLILTMRQNQKYFPLFDRAGKLVPRFLIVSNMQVADPRHIIGGNEKVVRPRLEDARFFYNQDRKTRLEERVP
ncbi:MAG TPA: glycine--tRNA ligase subunit beta, partial [Burkholderiales bacterium]|nr:glycine--tRNA ligase subunit beta [Burkholderiales bacterium]